MTLSILGAYSRWGPFAASYSEGLEQGVRLSDIFIKRHSPWSKFAKELGSADNC